MEGHTEQPKLFSFLFYDDVSFNLRNMLKIFGVPVFLLASCSFRQRKVVCLLSPMSRSYQY